MKRRTDIPLTDEAEARQRDASREGPIAEATEQEAPKARPRVGVGQSGDGRSAAELAGEPVAPPA